MKLHAYSMQVDILIHITLFTIWGAKVFGMRYIYLDMDSVHKPAEKGINSIKYKCVSIHNLTILH